MLFYCTVKPLYSEQSRDPKKCSLYRGVHLRGVIYVHVHMTLCLQYNVHIKTVPSLLVRDSAGGRAIFHEFFFLFIIYFMIFLGFFLYRYIYILVLNYVYSKQPIFGLTQELLREVRSLFHRLIVYHSSSIHSPRFDVHTMTKLQTDWNLAISLKHCSHE